MSQIPLFETPRLTVTEFTRRVRRLLEGDPALADVWVQGEISNFSRRLPATCILRSRMREPPCAA